MRSTLPDQIVSGPLAFILREHENSPRLSLPRYELCLLLNEEAHDLLARL